MVQIGEPRSAALWAACRLKPAFQAVRAAVPARVRRSEVPAPQSYRRIFTAVP